MTQKIKKWLTRTFQKPICPCSVCKKPMYKSEVLKSDAVFYDIREPAGLYTDLSIDLKHPSNPNEDFRMGVDDYTEIKFNPPILPGEEFVIETKGKLKDGVGTVDTCTIKVGVRVCKDCSRQYDPLTIHKRVRDYLLKRDGKTYTYLESEIAKLEKGLY